MQKKYVVRLSNEERAECQSVIKKLSGSSEKVRRAQILLKAAADRCAWTDEQISEALAVEPKPSRTFANDLSKTVFVKHWMEKNDHKLLDKKFSMENRKRR